MWLDWNKQSNSGPLGHLANQQGFWQWFLQFLSVFYIHKSCSIYPSSFFGKYIDMGDHGRSGSSPSWRLLEFCQNLFPFPISWLWEWHRITSTDWLFFAGVCSKPHQKKTTKNCVRLCSCILFGVFAANHSALETYRVKQEHERNLLNVPAFSGSVLWSEASSRSHCFECLLCLF